MAMLIVTLNILKPILWRRPKILDRDRRIHTRARTGLKVEDLDGSESEDQDTQGLLFDVYLNGVHTGANVISAYYLLKSIRIVTQLLCRLFIA